MKAALLALGTAGLLAQAPVIVPPPGHLPAGPLVDARDHQPLLLGPTTAKAILAHRAVFRENLATVKLTADLQARWKAVRHPFTLVAVFGSWCGDSHYQLPGLLALEAEPNPFVEVHYLGVNRDKALDAAAWPKGCAPQKVVRVPTFYLFATQPGGDLKLMGTVVENPPRAGQSMAEALVELVEAGAKAR
ncbi:MAG TPA: thioredoxin family protein [Geothrix sp.]|nr:thioredoxin family protein [Geothrix sp.]